MDYFGIHIIIIITGMLMITVYSNQTSNLDQATTGNLLQYRNGDILLGGLMRVHRRGVKDVCTEIQDDGVEAVETMNMMVDMINADDTILRGVKLGTIMVDTCDIDRHALKRAVVEFLPLFWELDDKSNSSKKIFAGVVGAASSAVSMQIANLLQVFGIPQISYWSTSPDLSNKDRYKYFFRTVPSDIYQARAMVYLTNKLGWNYISVVYEDDFYGVRGYRELQYIASSSGICIAVAKAVPRNPKPEDFTGIIQDLLKQKKARAVILFTKKHDAELLIRAANNIPEAKGYFVWIGSDGFTQQIPIVSTDDSYNPSLDGTIGFTPHASYVPGLYDYMTNLTLEDHMSKPQRNPWFKSYLSKKLKCDMPGTTKLHNATCPTNSSLDKEHFITYKKMQNVADAVLGFVHALDIVHKQSCGGARGMCDNLTKLAGTNAMAALVYQQLLNLTFKGINEQELKFDTNQDGPAIYSVVNYQVNRTVKNQHENWDEIGVFRDNEIVWKSSQTLAALGTTHSVCSEPCGVGQAKIFGTDKCCWECLTCAVDQYVTVNETCEKCPTEYFPNDNKTECVKVTLSTTSYDSTFGIATLILGCLGLVLTIIVIGVYIVHKETAIVKASGQELCFFVLFGVLLTFTSPFSMMAGSSPVSCACSRLVLSLGPTIMYAGLLVKTVRIVIIFQAKKMLSPQVKTFLRPIPQIISALSLVIIQVFVIVVWFISLSPAPSLIHQTLRTSFLACPDLINLRILIGLIYPFILIVVCTILATINRNVPTGFNETQYVVFTVYTTCVIWLAYVPIFLTNQDNHNLKMLTTSVCLSLSAATVLFCLFGARCYVILFHPEDNTSSAVMNTNPNSRVSLGDTSVTARKTSAQTVSTRASSSAYNNSVVFHSHNNNKNNNRQSYFREGNLNNGFLQ